MHDKILFFGALLTGLSAYGCARYLWIKLKDGEPVGSGRYNALLISAPLFAVLSGIMFAMFYQGVYGG